MRRSDINYNELSPMMKQYMDIKKNYENHFLFFRVGDFYELFFEDGELASRELELTLTGKNAGLKERIPMCGVPHHSIKPYIEKLVNKGYKVAICDQMEDAKYVKGMVKREVTEVISKGTFVDLDFLESYDFNYIGSILDLEYAYLLTYTDISTGYIYSQLINHNESSLLNVVLNLNLKELILKNDFKIELINIFKNNYGININISNNLYEEKNNLIESINDELIKEGVKHLLYYLIVSELKDITHFSEVIIKKENDYLLMDVQTVRNLELFETLRVKERQYSLIWLLDKCKTSMGSRTLKDWLLNPLKNKEEINYRFDIIENLNNEFILRGELLNYLYEIYDLERLCGKLICGNFNARDALQIKRSIKVLPEIKKIIKNLNIKIELEGHHKLYELLDKSIYEDPPVSLKEGYIIKNGYNSELDELKSIRSGGKEFIASIEQKERELSGIANLKVGYNKIFGYYLEVSKGNINKIKPEFGWERRQTLTTGERYITPELKEKEALVLNAEERIIELEYSLFMDIKNILKENIISLKTTASNIGFIDALGSLSIASEEYHLIRPTFNDNYTLNIKNGFHPVISVVSNKEYVKNDIIMDKDINTLLITGPNMSGKSTYMRQLAITVLMAQMGSFVPCDKADLPIFDKIFTRIGASDDLVGGESTFMVEMLEARNAIVNATKNSLILFDELGRGTATYDGMSIAEAILEYINTNINCKTLFSTHYHELTVLDQRFNNIKNIHVSATLDNDKLIFLHKVKEGSVDKSYGVHVAALALMPEIIIKRANEILSDYEKTKNTNKNNSKQLSFILPVKDELREYLKNIDPLNITPMEALKVLADLQNIALK